MFLKTNPFNNPSKNNKFLFYKSMLESDKKAGVSHL